MQYQASSCHDSESQIAFRFEFDCVQADRQRLVSLRRRLRGACLALVLAPSLLATRARADGPLHPVHLRVGGKEVALKITPLADDQNTYVPIEALAPLGLEAKRDAKGETAHVVQNSTRRSTDLAFARPNGQDMLNLSEVATFLNGHVVRTEIIGKDNRPIPGSLGDTVYLLARVIDVKFQNNALYVSTSFPVPFQVRKVADARTNTSRIECIGAQALSSVPVMSASKDIKVNAKQYSLDTAHITVELPTGMALSRADNATNTNSLIVVDAVKAGRGSANGADLASSGRTERPGKTDKTTPDSGQATVQTPKPIDGGTVASVTPPQRGAGPSRSGAVRRNLPVEIQGISLVPESDTRVHLDITTSDSTGAFVHYLPGGKLAVDVQNALPHLVNDGDLDQKMTHPLLTGLHAELLQDSPAVTRITCETSRIVGFTVTSQGGKISIDMRLPRNATGALADKVIVVDAGHGGSSEGATAGGFAEKNITLQIALKLREALEACGAKVVMTRDRDVNVDLSARPALANDINADLFVSIHNDSFTSDARGTSTYYHMSDPSSRALANSVSQAVAAVSGIPSRGALSDGILYNSGLAVLRQSRMPAILVEVAFISNTLDRRKLIDSAFQTRVADAICGGLRAYVEGGTPVGGRRMGMDVKEAPPIPGDTLEKSGTLNNQ